LVQALPFAKLSQLARSHLDIDHHSNLETPEIDLANANLSTWSARRKTVPAELTYIIFINMNV